MMSDYDDTNTGVLFREDEKQTERHPDMKGKINVEGKWYWLSGWKKVGKNSGKAFLSLSVTPQEGASRGAKAAAGIEAEVRQQPVGEDEIPF